MLAAHTDEIGFLVKYIDDKGFLRLQTLGGHDPANMVSQRVLVTTANGEIATGRPATRPQAATPLAKARTRKPPKADEFYVDLGIERRRGKREGTHIGDYATMDRTLEKGRRLLHVQRRWTTGSGCS